MVNPQLSVSVIITAYNLRQFIAEAIDSALAQSRPPAEIWVIDDGSTDGTAAFISARYADQPLVRLYSRENRGQLASFVDGATRSSGDILAFLDADDVWQPHYLERVLATYEAWPEVNYIYTNMRFFGAMQGLLLSDTQSRNMGFSILLSAYSNHWSASATSALSFRRGLVLDVLNVPERFLPQWRTRADDWLIFGSDILGGCKYYIAEPLVGYRGHQGNSWLNQPANSATSLRHKINRAVMRDHFRHRAGLSAELQSQVLCYVKQEFQTRQSPTLADLKRYSHLLRMSSLPLLKRSTRYLAMWRHYLKTRFKSNCQR